MAASILFRFFLGPVQGNFWFMPFVRRGHPKIGKKSCPGEPCHGNTDKNLKMRFCEKKEVGVPLFLNIKKDPHWIF